MPKKKREPRRHPFGPPAHAMGFDLGGRPLPLTTAQTNDMVDRAYDDPRSHVLAVIMRRGPDLFLQINGPPSKATLEALKRVLADMIKAYDHILKGQ